MWRNMVISRWPINKRKIIITRKRPKRGHQLNQRTSIWQIDHHKRGKKLQQNIYCRSWYHVANVKIKIKHQNIKNIETIVTLGDIGINTGGECRLSQIPETWRKTPSYEINSYIHNNRPRTKQFSVTQAKKGFRSDIRRRVTNP